MTSVQHTYFGAPLRRRAVFGACVCALAGAALFHFFGNAARGYIATRSLFVWWGRQWFDAGAEAQHGMFVLAAALWLFWRNRRRAGAGAANDSGWAGVAAVVGAVLLHLVGYTIQQSRVSIGALLLFTWGVAHLGGGRPWGQSATFPLAFLLFAVPLGFLDEVSFHLRLWVTQLTAAVGELAGWDVVRNGTQLSSADGRFQYDVAAACSGIRSLTALVALGVLFGYLRFHDMGRRWLLALAVLPFAFAGNLVRLLTIVAAGHYGSQKTGERVHEVSGVLIYLVVLALLFATVRLLERRRPGAAPPHPEPSPEAGANPAPAWAVPIALLAVAGAAWACAAVDRRPTEAVAGVRLADNGNDPAGLPEFIGTEWIGQRLEVTRTEREVLPADTGYARRNYVAVADRSRQVFFSIVLSGRDRSSIHRPELCLAGQGWTVAARRRAEFVAPGCPAWDATVLRLRHDAITPTGETVQVPALLAYWFVGREDTTPAKFGLFWRSAAERLTRLRSSRWAYVVVQTTAFDGEEAALDRMREVIAAVWPEVRAGEESRRMKAE